ncbi:hypothetical protein JB92DRAFT_2701590 [Gautieria morchelliformis]|nr:hypothetical protein JB92DRAFT_2701590 [Gautieria morchelliformis]
MPVFEGLLPPPFDDQLQDLLFVFSSWHGLAKLRLHTDTTLHNLEELTAIFGTLLRRFSVIGGGRTVSIRTISLLISLITHLIFPSFQVESRRIHAYHESNIESRRRHAYH